MYKKPVKKPHERVVPIESINRIERWKNCQRIGRIIYESSLSHESIANLYYLASSNEPRFLNTIIKFLQQ